MSKFHFTSGSSRDDHPVDTFQRIKAANSVFQDTATQERYVPCDYKTNVFTADKDWCLDNNTKINENGSIEAPDGTPVIVIAGDYENAMGTLTKTTKYRIYFTMYKPDINNAFLTTQYWRGGQESVLKCEAKYIFGSNVKEEIDEDEKTIINMNSKRETSFEGIGSKKKTRIEPPLAEEEGEKLPSSDTTLMTESIAATTQRNIETSKTSDGNLVGDIPRKTCNHFEAVDNAYITIQKFSLQATIDVLLSQCYSIRMTKSAFMTLMEKYRNDSMLGGSEKLVKYSVIRDENVKFPSYALGVMEELCIPATIRTLLCQCYAISMNFDEFMKLMEDCCNGVLRENYDGVQESYPPKF